MPPARAGGKVTGSTVARSRDIRAEGPTKKEGPGPYEHPLVAPQVTHFRQVPFRTGAMFPQSPPGSPA